MTTWVLLRGLMREARHWGDFPAQFKQIVGARQVVTLDFPGNGVLHNQISVASVAEMAQHLRGQLQAMNCAPPYALLALSLGAMVAVEWSAKHPEEIARMVLINTSLAPHNPFYHRLRPANYAALLRAMLVGTIAQRERLILRLTSAANRSPSTQTELLEQWIKYAREYPVTRANILRQLRAAQSYRTASTPAMPVLLLAGQHDQLVNAKCSLALAKNWNCALRSHPVAGHDLPLDDGAWVAQQVQVWCGEQT